MFASVDATKVHSNCFEISLRESTFELVLNLFGILLVRTGLKIAWFFLLAAFFNFFKLVLSPFKNYVSVHNTPN